MEHTQDNTISQLNQTQQQGQPLKKTKNGQVFKRSNILKSWNSRYIVLNFNKKQIEILSKKQGNNKIIDLANYNYQLVNKVLDKKYWALKLTAINKKKKKQRYQEVYFASLNQNDIQDWYNNIQNTLLNNQIEQNNDENTIKQQKQNNMLNSKIQDDIQQQVTTDINNQNKNLIQNNNNNDNENDKNIDILNAKKKINNNNDDNDDDDNLSMKHGDDMQEIQQQQLMGLVSNDLLSSQNGNILSTLRHERKPQEYIKLPYFSTYMKKTQWPGEKNVQYDLQEIRDATNKGPECFFTEINDILKWFLKEQGNDFWAQTRDQFEYLEENKNNYIFQNKKNKNRYRGIILCKSDPQYLYSELTLPSKLPHWHPSLKSFEIYPDEVVVKKQDYTNQNGNNSISFNVQSNGNHIKNNSNIINQNGNSKDFSNGNSNNINNEKQQKCDLIKQTLSFRRKLKELSIANNENYMHTNNNIPSTQDTLVYGNGNNIINNNNNEQKNEYKIQEEQNKAKISKNYETDDKVMYYHRYGFSHKKSNAYFLVCKTLGSDYTENDKHSYEHFFNCTYKIFRSPETPEFVIVSTDIEIKFNEENVLNVRKNTIDFLHKMSELNHEPVEFKNDKNFILSFKYFGKIDEENSFDQQSINSKGSKLGGNKDYSNDLESLELVFEKKENNSSFAKKSSTGNKSQNNEISSEKKKFERTVTLGNAEIKGKKEDLMKKLESMKSNETTLNCISNYHEMNSVKSEENQLITSKQKGHFAWQNEFKVCEKNGGILYLNEKRLSDQRTVVLALMKRIGRNLLNGQSVMGISMPVLIFESRSMLERMARAFGHAPLFLKRAAESSDIIEQLKHTASFALSSFIMSIMQEKPFNPIIGETFQGRLNGHPIYFEQTSHHPPICNYLHYGPGYTLTGSHAPEISMSLNSFEGTQKAHPKVFYKINGKTIYIIWNAFTCYGLIQGQRSLNCIGRAFIFEPESRMVMEIVYNPQNKGAISNFFTKKTSKIDEIGGAIYKVKEKVMKQIIEGHKSYSKTTNNLQINPNKDIEQYVSKIDGVWHQKLNFDDEEYWNTDKDFPYQLDFEINPLPSDSQFREDAIWLACNDEDKSQLAKEKGEKLQRKDEKLRKQGSKKQSSLNNIDNNQNKKKSKKK